MKKLFSFGKKKKRGMSPSPSETGSVLSGYDVEVKELGKLHRAASSGDVDKIRQLLRKHDINEPDKESRTPLHLACALGHPDAVATLIENKPKLNICDSDHRSPLMKAIQCQQERCATILLEHGADPNVADINGNTALHFAALIPSMPLAVQLLDHGADINASNKEGCTPLILAVTENHEEIVEFLLNEGAEVNAINKSHRTSLLVAASKGYINLVKVLLQNNADPYIKDEKGWTPDDHAVVNGHHACSHLIIEHCARKPSATHHVSTSKFSATKSMVGMSAKNMEVTRDISEAGDLSESSASQKSGGANSWPSSDDESDLSPKKTSRPNLKEMLDKRINAIQKHSVTAAQPISFPLQNKSNSQEDSFHGSDNEDPPQPNPFPQTLSFNQRVPCTPGSYPKPFHLASSHLKETCGTSEKEKTLSYSGRRNQNVIMASKEACTSSVCSKGSNDVKDCSQESDEYDDTSASEEVEEVSETCEGTVIENTSDNDEECDNVIEEDESEESDDIVEDGSEESEDDVGDDYASEDGCEEVIEHGLSGNEWVPEGSGENQSDTNQDIMGGASENKDCTSDNEAVPFTGGISGETQDTQVISNNDVPISLIIGFYEHTDADVESVVQGETGSLTSNLKSEESTECHREIITQIVDGHKQTNNILICSSQEIYEIKDKASSPSIHDDSEVKNRGQIDSSLELEEARFLPSANTFSEDQSADKMDGHIGTDLEDSDEESSAKEGICDSLLERKLQDRGGPGDLLTKTTSVDIYKQPVTVTSKGASTSHSVKQKESNVKSDMMADLGLDDADGIEDLSDWDSTSDSLDQSNLDPKPRKQLPEHITARLENPAIPTPVTACPELAKKEPERIQSTVQDKGLESTIKHLQEFKNTGDVMADLGLDDPAGIEDLSDWDSTSYSLEQSNLIPKTVKLPSETLPATPRKPAIPTPVTAYPEPKEEETESMQPALQDRVLKSNNKHLQQAKNSGDVMEDLQLDDAGGIDDLSDWDSTSDSVEQSNLNPKPRKPLSGPIPATLEKPAISIPVTKCLDPTEESEGIQSGMQDKVLESTNKHLQQAKNTGDSLTEKLSATSEHKPLSHKEVEEANLNEQKLTARHRPSKGKNTVKIEGTKNVILNTKLEPSHNSHDENGKLPEMFDDSTLSDASQDDEGGEAGIHTNWKNKVCNPDEYDEFSHSSDTGTDEHELLGSTFRNAVLLIDQLNAAGLDSVNLLKIQNIIHEYERSVQKEKGRHAFLAQKVKSLENERKDLQQIKDTNRELASVLEHQKVDFESDLGSLRFSLKQEEEKRKNAEMLYERVGDQLRKKEDQCCKEMQEKQQLELTLRNMELELRSLRNNMKQVEEERNEAQRLLSQERNARVIEEEILNNMRRKNEEQEAKIIQAKTAEVLAQPSDAGEKDLIHTNLKLQEEIAIVKQELIKLQSKTNEEESQYTEENEMLKEKIDDLRRDLKNNEESLTQTVYQYNGQLNVLKREASMLCTKLEHEKQSKERLENELESIRSRLTTALQELERTQLLKTDLERTLQRERDDWMRSKDKLNHDLSNLRETNNGTSQQLSIAETKCNSLESELHRVGFSLQEKSLLLESAQRELVQAQDRTEKLERTLQFEKEQANKNIIKQESMQERLAQIQSENIQLRQQLEDFQSKGITKEKAVSDIQDRFTDIFNKVRADNERQVHLVEERNKDLINKSNELREQIYKLETEKVERESSLRNLQNELADALKKLAMSEASLQVTTQYRNDLDEKKQHLQKELEKYKMKLQDMEEQFIQSERQNHQLKNLLDDKEREIGAAVQKMQEFSLVAAEAEKSVKQLEQHVQRLEIENAKIETEAKQQTSQTEILQKELKESISSWNRMEELLTHVQSSKIDLEEKLNQQVHMKAAHDTHNLWEEELKSISRLSIRLAGVEREKSELTDQVECERKKVKKLVEMKKSFETRFDQEVKRNNELQREMAGLKTLLKAAKKKLKGRETVENQQAKFEEGTKHPNLDAADSEVRRLKHKVEELSLSLERETAKSAQLECTNQDLQGQLSSMKILQKKYDQLEKGKRHLEENIAELKRLVESNKMDQNLLEKYKKEVQERGRQELQQKLDEVNLFLQAQAASQESLEQMQAANDASIRNQLENRIQDLESELHKIKMTLQESACQKDSFLLEMNRFKDLYADEMKMRKSLAAKLERANEKLEEAKAKLLNEREKSKSFIASSIVNGSLTGTPVIDTSQLGLLYGNSSVNGTFGLGGSFLNPVGNGLPTNRVDTYLSKMQHELEKSIAKELEQANTEFHTMCTRISPVGSTTAGSVRIHNPDQDPVSRVTQQYLEVLQKNCKI